RTFEKFLLGLQTQSDFASQRHFGGLRFEYTGMDWWRPSAMLFTSYATSDQWLQLKSVFTEADWQLALVYDNIHGGNDDDDLFGFYRNLDRFLVDLSFTY